MKAFKPISLFLILFLSLSAHAASMMVDTQWLADHKQDANLVLIDMSGDSTQYQRFHIPGAVYLAYGNLVQKRKKDKVSVRISDQRLYKILGLIGVSRESHVVIYDDMGGLHAGRLYWELERIGHPRVSIVDGGLVKWILEGRKVDNKEFTRPPVKYTPADKIIPNIVDMDEVLKAQASGSHTLIDVRTKEEYAGHPKFKRSGHIPGAQFWPWDDSLDLGKGFVLKSGAELQKSLEKIGVKDKEKPLILYCNSGHRASQSYMTLKHLGYKNIKLYDGSMKEYAKNKKAPIKQGMKP